MKTMLRARHGVWLWAALLGVVFAVSLAAVWQPPTSASAPVSPLLTATPTPTSTSTPGCGFEWTVTASPNITSGDNYLLSVSSTSSNDAWAVGWYSSTLNTRGTLTLHWDGVQWSTVPSPSPGLYLNVLNDVEAIAPNDVWAVGWYNNDPAHPTQHLITMHWNGSVWALIPNPDPGGNYTNFLTGVSAISSTDVWAVGFWRQYSPQALVLHWNGSAWTQAPNPPYPYITTFEKVAAIADDNIWAPGTTSGTGDMWHWNGTAWSIIASPNVGVLHDVSAISATDIWAVGDSGIIHWDGVSWTQAVTPPGAGGGLAVSATSASNAWAAGSLNSNVLQWNGAQWVFAGNGGPSTALLRGVEALPSGEVWAVGTQDIFNKRTLIERRSLTCLPTATPTPPTATPTPTCGPTQGWTLMPGPNADPFWNTVRGVAAPSDGSVLAVGSREQGSAEQAIAARWNGASWALVPVPTPGTRSALKAISALAPGTAWAVGNYNYGTSQGQLPFIVRWDGSQWTQESVPQPGGGNADLTSVSAISSSDVWAVGSYSAGSGSPYRTLAYHWNGAQWLIVWPPNANNEPNYLLGVSARNSGDAWAVGYYYSGTQQLALTMRWNGAVWALIPAQSPGPTASVLQTVKSISTTEAWAAGWSGSSSGTVPLVERWDGAQWSVVAAPSLGQQSYFFGLDAWGGSLWAVGYYRLSTTGASLTLTERWTGSEWVFVQSPNPGGIANVLYSVAFGPQGEAWAAGDSLSSSGLRTLVLRNVWGPCGSGFTPTPTPPTPTTTPPACTITFSDVSPSDYFYEAVRYLYCHGAISGYADGTFRPYNFTTRGQLCKIVMLAEGWSINTSGGPHFSDVVPGSAFYDYVETAYNRGIISGYADGTFRPGNNVTRGQLCKIVVEAEGWPINTTGGPHFTDVAPGSAFYDYVETAYNRGIISGYADGTFRPGNSATRGQVSKIVYNAVSGGPAPSRRR